MHTDDFKPLLAADVNLAKLRYPVYGSPKLDGIRAACVDGRLLTRALKLVPNRHVRELFNKPEYEGFDGELIVGSPVAFDVYRETISGVMRYADEPDVTWYVFDKWDHIGEWASRFQELRGRIPSRVRIDLLQHKQLRNEAELLAYESQQIDAGYEGIVLRDPTAPYKFGRSTVKEGYLLKMKRFEDSEATVLAVEEEMFNGNLAQTNELGRTQRSTARAGLTGKGRMGALHVRDVKTGVEFHIGSGFTAADREWFWRSDAEGLTIKYKFFPVGMKNLPRHPVYLGMRDSSDM